MTELRAHLLTPVAPNGSRRLGHSQWRGLIVFFEWHLPVGANDVTTAGLTALRAICVVAETRSLAPLQQPIDRSMTLSVSRIDSPGHSKRRLWRFQHCCLTYDPKESPLYL
mmetsp:Transcript_10961/g.32755  ORF Transcript_10961/g.32755 Transcript_10961/m.32755 type:complete len:111 (+) Transcript_10961:706-1038(+)